MIKPISVKGLKRYALKERKSKVYIHKMGKPYKKGLSFLQFINTLPEFLAAKQIKEIASAIVNARKKDKIVVLAMGAHPIKVGLSPIIIDLMQKGIVTALATNGAAIVHDFEIAYMGSTSEDVAEALKNGSFGMAAETAINLNKAIKKGADKEIGIGKAIGELISTGKFPNAKISIFAEAYKLKLPATVHVCIGTDIIHMHPECDGEAIGKATMIDFKIFCSIISKLQEGVFINLGSAVVMPEVFLKALSVVRNLGYKVDNITTVTMDFQKHYRPTVNVVQRPTISGGKGYYIIGHHEIMFPLLAAIVLEIKENLTFNKFQ